MQAVLERVTETTTLPLLLELTEPVTCEVAPTVELEAERVREAKEYDPVRQVRITAERMGEVHAGHKTNSPGICTCFVGGIDISCRDTVQDD